MNKQAFQRKLSEIDALITSGKYAEAVDECDQLDLTQIQQSGLLQKIAKAYEKVRRYLDAEEMLKQARLFAPHSRGVLFHLVNIAIKAEELDNARDYYEQFLELAPDDTQRYVLLYRLGIAFKATDEELIEILEDYVQEEPDDRWMYELAGLCYKAGYLRRSYEVCNDILLWFGNGRFVDAANELKAAIEEDAIAAAAQNEGVYYDEEPQEETPEQPYEPAEEETTPEEAEKPEAVGGYEIYAPAETTPEETAEQSYEKVSEEPLYEESPAYTQASAESLYEESSDEEAYETPADAPEYEEIPAPAESFSPSDFAAQLIREIYGTHEEEQDEEDSYEEQTINPVEHDDFEAEVPEDEPEKPEQAEGIYSRPESEYRETVWQSGSAYSREEKRTSHIFTKPIAPVREEIIPETVKPEQKPVNDLQENLQQEYREELSLGNEPEEVEEEENRYDLDTQPVTMDTLVSGGALFDEGFDSYADEMASDLFVVDSTSGEGAAVELGDTAKKAAAAAAEQASPAMAFENKARPLTALMKEVEEAEALKHPLYGDEPLTEQAIYGVAGPDVTRPIEYRNAAPAAGADAADDEDFMADMQEIPITGELPKDFVAAEIVEEEDAEEVPETPKAVETPVQPSAEAAPKANSKPYGGLPVEPDMDKGIWHFVVFGDTDALTLECAREKMKEIHDDNPNGPSKMMKISAKKMVGANIVNSLDRFLGCMVIVQQASSLTDEQLREFAKVLDHDDQSLLVAFTDTERRMKELFNRVPELADSFTAVFEGRRFTAESLMAVADDYLYRESAKLTPKAREIVLQYAIELLEEHKGFYRNDMLLFIESALEKADRGGFLGFGGGKVDKEGFLLVAEKYFNK